MSKADRQLDELDTAIDKLVKERDEYYTDLTRYKRALERAEKAIISLVTAGKCNWIKPCCPDSKSKKKCIDCWREYLLGEEPPQNEGDQK